MTVNFNGSLVGLSLLTGTNAFTTNPPIAFESNAVLKAKKLFTTPPTTPPWKQPADKTPESAQVSAIKALKTIIDKPGTGVNALPTDVETSFTAYKALDRLRVLAQASSNESLSDAQRKSLQETFAKGLADLQTYLGTAPSDLLRLGFGKQTSTVKSVGIPAPDNYTAVGKPVADQRADAIPGLTGNEVFTVKLSKPGATDTLTIDLSTGPQPPTLDSVADAINAAIQAIPARNPDGTIYYDPSGNTRARWQSSFDVTKNGEGWGLTLKNASGNEQISIDQVGAGDALVVATGQTSLDAPTSTTVFRYDDPTGAMDKKTLANIAAIDTRATESAELSGKTHVVYSVKTDDDGKSTVVTSESSETFANTDAAAIATDAEGSSYIVGTTKGDLGSFRNDGKDNLFLTKVDSEGKIVWQRSLGAGTSLTGAAVSIGPNGDVVVAGTASGAFDGVDADGDMLVARFSASGDEKFATTIANFGSESASAVAVAADGSIYVGGRTAPRGDTAVITSGDAFVAHIDVTGKVVERRTIDEGGSENINALAIDASGNLLALVNSNGVASVRRMDAAALTTDLGSVTLGTASARALAVAADGSIAVGGATSAAISGAQVNATSGGSDGFVTRIGADLTGATTTYLGTAADDQVDSITFLNGDLYVGGRTTGDLGAVRRGSVDGFVSRIDTTTGAIATTTQFGIAQTRTEPVRIAASAGGGANAVSALGFSRGTIDPEPSTSLVSQTSLRPGDSFSISLDGGTMKKITIGADDTMKTLTDQIKAILGKNATVTALRLNGQQTLGITAAQGHAVELTAGPEGSDALQKLGIEAQRIAAAPAPNPKDPKVKPGGSFGLKLSDVMNISTLDDAKFALGAITDAISISQTAYRSLYWDDTKAALVNASTGNAATGTHSTAIEQAQLANYQAALTRLTAGAPTGTGLFGF